MLKFVYTRGGALVYINNTFAVDIGKRKLWKLSLYLLQNFFKSVFSYTLVFPPNLLLKKNSLQSASTALKGIN